VRLLPGKTSVLNAQTPIWPICTEQRTLLG
jgi:hypothetical protein